MALGFLIINFRFYIYNNSGVLQYYAEINGGYKYLHIIFHMSLDINVTSLSSYIMINTAKINGVKQTAIVTTLHNNSYLR